jgi:integrase
MIAMLIGCGLRRGELLALRVDSIQSREEHSVIADPLGKAGHIRTVPIPPWVKVAIDEWKEAGRITEGALSRSNNKQNRPDLGNWHDAQSAVGGGPSHRDACRN